MCNRPSLGVVSLLLETTDSHTYWRGFVDSSVVFRIIHCMETCGQPHPSRPGSTRRRRVSPIGVTLLFGYRPHFPIGVSFLFHYTVEVLKDEYESESKQLLDWPTGLLALACLCSQVAMAQVPVPMTPQTLTDVDHPDIADLGKEALLPNPSGTSTATFKNYTSYSRGINGVMVDIDDAFDPTSITADDFEFRVGNDNTPSGWSLAPAPTSVTVREGAGTNGSDRVTIIWADNAIEKEWLRVEVKATPETGLAVPDVFYFGNAVGESGNSTTDAMVTTTDEEQARDNTHGLLNLAAISDPCDFNRDRVVNMADRLIARGNQTDSTTALKLIMVSAE